MKPSHGKSTTSGVSLIELMIALAIGTLLLVGLVQIFSASRTAYQLSTGLARVQENGRFAMDFLQRDLRMAGHVGCVNDQARFLPENVTVSRPALASTFLTDAQQLGGNYDGVVTDALRFDNSVQGYDAKVNGTGATTGTGSAITLVATPALAASGDAWSPRIPAQLAAVLTTAPGAAVQNSDVVVLRYFNPAGAQMVSFTPGSPATFTFKGGSRLLEGVTNPALFGISDCLNSAVFEATSATIPNDASTTGSMSVAITGLNKSGLLGTQSFVAGQATIYRAESIVYYVGLNSNNNPALYRVRFSATPGAAALTATKEEMVEGIETLQFQYGQDSRTAASTRPTGNIGSSVLANAVQPTGDLTKEPTGDLSTAWRRVGMVQVGLVARSPDQAAAQQRDASVAGLSALGVTVNPPAIKDGRYRAVYEDSIAFRNRLFGN